MKKGQSSTKKTTSTAAAKKPAKRAPRKKKEEEISASAIPLMSETSASVTSTRTRSNRSARIDQLHRFENIDKGIVPFNYSSAGYGNKTSNIDVRDAVILCQKAYYNFSVFRIAMRFIIFRALTEQNHYMFDYTNQLPTFSTHQSPVIGTAVKVR